jgi:hypothetical protein
VVVIFMVINEISSVRGEVWPENSLNAQTRVVRLVRWWAVNR